MHKMNFISDHLLMISYVLSKASTPAKKLLKEKDRKTFFQKYSSVSQELEKCLDCLLLMSDSMTALGEEDTQGMLITLNCTKIINQQRGEDYSWIYLPSCEAPRTIPQY